MPQPSRPSKDELSKLSFHALCIYESRCALRSLPMLCQSPRGLHFWETNKQHRYLKSMCLSSIIGYLIKPNNLYVTTSPNNNLIDTIFNDALTAANTITGNTQNNRSARAAALRAANAAHTAYTGTKPFININADSYAYAYAYSEVYIDNNARRDYKELSNKPALSVINNPLLHKSNSDEKVHKNLDIFYKILKLNNLSEFIGIYKLFLAGFDHQNSKINDWFERKWPRLIAEYQINDDALNFDSTYSQPLHTQYASILSEAPSSNDQLGRAPIVNAITQLVSASHKTDSTTIGLLGDWGSGKTTVLNLLSDKLTNTNRTGTNFIVHTFNAWSYEHTDDIQAGMAYEAIEALTSHENWLSKIGLAFKLNLRINTFNLWKNIGILSTWTIFVGVIAWVKTIGLITMSANAIGISGLVSLYLLYKYGRPLLTSTYSSELVSYLNLPNYKNALGQLPVYQEHIKVLAELTLNPKNKQEQRLLFIVDDLDRCSPDGIIKVFEAIRLVMELDRVAVVMAIDHRIALATLAHHYQDLADESDSTDKYRIARDYLGKIIHLPIRLHEPTGDDLNTFVDAIFEPFIDESKSDDSRNSDMNEPAEIVNNDEEPSETIQTQSNGDSNSGNTNPDNHPPLKNKPDTPTELGANSKEKVVILSTPLTHTLEEKAQFIDLCKRFSLSNPRQLKRLQNSYRLVCTLFAEYSEGITNELLMIALFAQEYTYAQQSQATGELDETGWESLIKSDDAGLIKDLGVLALVDPYILPGIH